MAEYDTRKIWGFKEFLQVFGLATFSGVLSMYVTQRTIVKDLDAMSSRLESIQEELEYRASRDREYLEYKIDSYSQKQKTEVQDIRRRLNILEIRSGISGNPYGGKDG